MGAWSIFLSVFFLRAEVFGDGEGRHDGGVVYGIVFHFVQNFQRIRKGLGHVGKKLVHLCLGFHPFLLGVEHPFGVVQILLGTEADEAVVCFGVFFVHKVHVVRADNLDIVFLGILQQLGVHFLLQREGFVVGTFDGCLVALQF